MSHTYCSLTYHIVFSTKKRTRIIPENVSSRLYAYIASIINDEYGYCRIINGQPDHIHILADIKPQFSISKVLERVKSHSSRFVKKDLEVGDEFAWQIGYGAFTVSASVIQKVYRYIKNQHKHHQEISFQEELIKFLIKHDVKFDKRYIWD